MKIEPTALPGVVILTPARFGDARGFFAESWNRKRMAEAGLEIDFVQDNHSLSARTGTVQGLHFQSPTMPRSSWCAAGAGGCGMWRWTSVPDRRPTGAGWG